MKWQLRNENFTVNFESEEEKASYSPWLSVLSFGEELAFPSVTFFSDPTCPLDCLSLKLILHFSKLAIQCHYIFRYLNFWIANWNFNSICKNEDLGVHDNYLLTVEGLSWERWKPLFCKGVEERDRCCRGVFNSFSRCVVYHSRMSENEMGHPKKQYVSHTRGILDGLGIADLVIINAAH